MKHAAASLGKPRVAYRPALSPERAGDPGIDRQATLYPIASMCRLMMWSWYSSDNSQK